MKQKIKPSGFYYAIPVAVMIIGIILFVLNLFSGIKSMLDNNNVADIGSSEVIILNESGKYYIYIDEFFIDDVKVEQKIFVKQTNNQINELKVKVYKKGNENSPITLNKMPNNTNLTMSVNQSTYKAILIFEIEEAGEYVIESSLVDSNVSLENALMVNNTGVGDIFMVIIKTFLIIGLTIALSLTSFLVILLKRKKYAKSLA